MLGIQIHHIMYFDVALQYLRVCHVAKNFRDLHGADIINPIMPSPSSSSNAHVSPHRKHIPYFCSLLGAQTEVSCPAFDIQYLAPHKDPVSHSLQGSLCPHRGTAHGYQQNHQDCAHHCATSHRLWFHLMPPFSFYPSEMERFL